MSFEELDVSPKFSSSAKLMQQQLKQFRKETKTKFPWKAYTPESFRETMMGVAAKKLHPYQLMYVTSHKSERSIKHTYIAKQKTNTFQIYNNIIHNLFN